MSSALASLLASIMAFYDNFTQPFSFLASFSIFVSPLDVVGAFRLALVLRQLRELFHGEHVKKLKAAGGGTSGRPGKDLAEVERRARTRDLVTTFVMVYGGEAVVGTCSPSTTFFAKLILVFRLRLTSPLAGYTALFHARGHHPRHIRCHAPHCRGTPCGSDYEPVLRASPCATRRAHSCAIVVQFHPCDDHETRFAFGLIFTLDPPADSSGPLSHFSI